MLRSLLFVGAIGMLAGGCKDAPPATAPRPCFTIQGSTELRSSDAAKTIEDIAKHIRLAPDDEALRQPTSMADIKTMLHRDVVYAFADGAAYAKRLDTTEGRIYEATLELLLGESQLISSQVLTTQEAWVGSDLRIARANLAGEGKDPSTDRGRMLAQLIRAVEEGNKIADALGDVAPKHLVRGAELVRRLETEAPNDPRTSALAAEYHRLRGEWKAFETAMTAAEANDRKSQALCYLRGMEQLERFRKPDRAVAALRACLVSYPSFVRAQAALVLMAATLPDGVRELAKLQQMNQDHYMVMLLEPTLAADQELVRMQTGGSREVER